MFIIYVEGDIFIPRLSLQAKDRDLERCLKLSGRDTGEGRGPFPRFYAFGFSSLLITEIVSCSFQVGLEIENSFLWK